MATLANTALTWLDWAKRVDPDGNTADVVELLGQTNEVLTDMLWVKGNLPTGHRTTVRTGLPTVYWRKLNAGVLTSKSDSTQHDEMCGMLEGYSEVDTALAELNGNTAEFRLSEAKPFLESLSQELASTIFYGNAGTAPEEFTGLATRYATVSTSTSPAAKNVVDGGGTGSDNSSVWFVLWGEETVHGIFPGGSKAGVHHKNLGEVTVENAGGVTGARMQAFRDHWALRPGIAVRDWRAAARVCNIDISNLVAMSSAADLETLMIKAWHRIPMNRNRKPVGMVSGRKGAIYMNRTCFEMLDIQRRDDVQVGGQLKYEVVDGIERPTFRGWPVGLCDALLETEARVV